MIDNTRTLVVESDAHSLVAIASILRALHIDYKRNTSGARVVQQALDTRPDFILLDVELPNGDPFAIYEALSCDPVLQHVPVIAIGDSQALIPLLPRIQACGFAGVLTKPLIPENLASLLRTVLV